MSLLLNNPFCDVLSSLSKRCSCVILALAGHLRALSNDVRSVIMRLFRISISLRGIIWRGLCGADRLGICWVMVGMHVHLSASTLAIIIELVA